jgi:hypothetical protein
MRYTVRNKLYGQTGDRPADRCQTGMTPPAFSRALARGETLSELGTMRDSLGTMEDAEQTK